MSPSVINKVSSYHQDGYRMVHRFDELSLAHALPISALQALFRPSLKQTVLPQTPPYVTLCRFAAIFL